MNDLLHEMTATGPLIGAGGTLLFVGALLWHLPRVYRGLFELRTSSAARLRAAGEEERAQRLETETAALRRRVPIVDTHELLGADLAQACAVIRRAVVRALVAAARKYNRPQAVIEALKRTEPNQSPQTTRAFGPRV